MIFAHPRLALGIKTASSGSTLHCTENRMKVLIAARTRLNSLLDGIKVHKGEIFNEWFGGNPGAVT
jgi:hypothetical protein